MEYILVLLLVLIIFGGDVRLLLVCYLVILTFFLHLDSSTVSTWTWIFFKQYTFFLLAKDVLLSSTILILVPSGQEIIF